MRLPQIEFQECRKCFSCFPPHLPWGDTDLNIVAGGQLEIMFVVDSRQDPAFETASALAKDSQGKSVRVLVATLSHTNSQKIHNIQTGIKVGPPAAEMGLQECGSQPG